MSAKTVYISIGSNIDPLKHIPSGLKALESCPEIVLLKVSSIYTSEAIGRPEQPEYCNGVVSIRTELDHEVLKETLRGIEAAEGRIRVEDRYAPRTLDLDIILYGEHHIDKEHVRIPDPGIQKWSFIYIPLLEINPPITIPGFDEPLAIMIPFEPQPPVKKNLRLTEAVCKGFAHE